MKVFSPCLVALVVCYAFLSLPYAAAYESMATSESVTLDPNRILCPVLAVLWNADLLKTDELGSATLDGIHDALHVGAWDDDANAMFQAQGISDYDESQKEIQLHRNRCLPGTPCWLKRKWKGHATPDTQRYVNIFKMNGHQALEHGFSTGTRGGASNVPEWDYTGGPCNGTYPCEERFQKFYVPCADENDRFYLKNINCVICKAQAFGDRTGEFGLNPLQGGRQWQMIAAMTGWLRAFGRLGPSKDPNKDDEIYLHMDDVRATIMEGRLPDNWEPRNWGSMGDFPEAEKRLLPCAAASGPFKGYYDPWWTNTSCPSFTGETCNSVLGNCKGGALCRSGRCLCGLDDKGISKCAKNGVCEERESKCTYFGEPCVVVLADNPAAPF